MYILHTYCVLGGRQALDLIRNRLERELKGDETPEQLEKRLKRVVREKLGIDRRRVTVVR
jgi:hypothetical protein